MRPKPPGRNELRSRASSASRVAVTACTCCLGRRAHTYVSVGALCTSPAVRTTPCGVFLLTTILTIVLRHSHRPWEITSLPAPPASAACLTVPGGKTTSITKVVGLVLALRTEDAGSILSRGSAMSTSLLRQPALVRPFAVSHNLRHGHRALGLKVTPFTHPLQTRKVMEFIRTEVSQAVPPLIALHPPYSTGRVPVNRSW